MGSAKLPARCHPAWAGGGQGQRGGSSARAQGSEPLSGAGRGAGVAQRVLTLMTRPAPEGPPSSSLVAASVQLPSARQPPSPPVHQDPFSPSAPAPQHADTASQPPTDPLVNTHAPRAYHAPEHRETLGTGDAIQRVPTFGSPSWQEGRGAHTPQSQTLPRSCGHIQAVIQAGRGLPGGSREGIRPRSQA